MREETTAKRRFLIVILFCFLTILIYELLTPMLSDDFTYTQIVREAKGIGDLFRQEAEQYFGWTGRSVVHMILRLFLYTGSETFFHIIASVVFTLLTLAMYRLTMSEVRFDVKRYLLGILLVWIFGVRFAETVLWETGACNYLFGTTIILGDMVLYHRLYEQCRTQGKASGEAKTNGEAENNRTFLLQMAGMAVAGLIAGWCNENTSGGLILYVAILLYLLRKEKISAPKPMLAGLTGNLVGFVLMITAPGNYNRAVFKEVNDNLIMQLAARFLHVTNAVYELFFPLLCALIVLALLLKIGGCTLQKATPVLVYTILFVATSYSLILAPQAENRAFFGAGIFLLIALLQAVELLRGEWKQLIKPAVTGILLLYFFFVYVDSGAKLAFIYREEAERHAYLTAQMEAGAEESGAPLLRPQFETKYSVAYEMDIQEDWKYWVNGQYAGYYNMHLVWGVPRSEWTEY